MNRDSFLMWLRTWLAQHPVRRPAQGDDPAYARQVLTRIGRTQPERPSVLAGLADALYTRLSPARLSLAAGGVLAAALFLVTTARQPQMPSQPQPAVVAAQITRDATVIAQAADAADDPLADVLNSHAIEPDLRMIDQYMMLAESGSSATSDDEAWITQTLQLLNEFNEDTDADTNSNDSASVDQWLQELQLLDESELKATS